MERSQHILTRWTWKHLGFDGLCPKLSSNTSGFAGGAQSTSVLQETEIKPIILEESMEQTYLK